MKSRVTKFSSALALCAAAISCCNIPAAAADAIAPHHANAAAAPRPVEGFASDTIRITLRPTWSVARTVDGALALSQDQSGVWLESAEILRSIGATAIDPVFTLPFGDPKLAASLGMDRMMVLRIPAGSDVEAIIARITPTLSPALEDIRLDRLASVAAVPNDPSYGLQYSLRNTGQSVEGQTGTTGIDIDAERAWNISTGNGQTFIAIVDTGISTTHPDVALKVMERRNFTSTNATDSDDRHGHGTHCAGISAARTNNSVGIAGVCWGCSLVGAKVLDDGGSGQWSWVAAGIQWSADVRGMRIISMSLGGGANDPAVEAAVTYANGRNVLVIAAAGNNYGGSVIYPAALPACLAVASTDNRDQRSTFSSVGPAVDISAPGTSVYSCYDNVSAPNSYTYMSGTSMATPHVSGVAGLVVSINPNLTNVEVREILEESVIDLGAPGLDPTFGHGRISAYLAAVAAQATLCPVDFNRDGTADFFDYLDFVSAFASNSNSADYNADSVIDLFDYLDFVAAFAVGC
ncbi:MAG: S8 family serine peptidase [Planctomycetes bacterium]|nr:S8 family serine peptidase [Planctomycetota bacterium]